MSILNVDKIQPIGGGSTITVDATDIQASTGTITANSYTGVDNTLKVSIGGTEYVRTHSTGQVSIGSTFMWRTDTVAQVYGKSPDLSLSRFNDQFMIAGNETSGAINTGAGIQFFGHDGVQERGMAYIRGLKENGTSGNRASYLAFATRPASGTLEERLRITSGGAIGINTSVPSTNQDLTFDGASNYKAGILYKQAGVNQYRFMCEGGTGHVYYDTYVNDRDHIFRVDTQATGGTEVFRITGDRKIGINEDVPQSTLHVASTSNYVDIGLSNSTSGHTGSDGANIFLNNNLELALWNRESTGVIRFATAGTERLRIDADGRMGLGVTPTASHSNVTASIFLKDGNCIFSRTGGQFLGLFQNIKYTSGDVTRYVINGFGSAYFQHTGTHRFYTAPSGTGNTNATLVERLRIDSSGRALINTTTATGAAKLQLLQTSGDGLLVRNHDTNYEGLILSNASGEARLLASSGGSTARPALTFFTSDAERLRIDTNGSVLIGSSTNNWKFQVFGGRSSFTDTTTYAIGVRKNNAQNSNYNYWIGAAAANNTTVPDMVFSNNTGTERLRITDDGRLSINDSSPNSNETLTIQPVGNIACDVALKLNNDNDSRIKFYDNTGTWRGGLNYTTYANSTEYPNFHDSFYFLTDPGSNGTLEVAMRVNNNGCFIYPKQPCFSVYMSSDYTSSTTHTANFNGERFDQGNNFNTGSNGIFTAPVTGKYFMHAVIQTRSGGDNQTHIMGVAFLINGSVNQSKGSGDQYWGRGNNHYMSVHNTRIVNLAQGDTVQVYIQLHGSVNIEGSGGTDRCNWQGYLIG